MSQTWGICFQVVENNFCLKRCIRHVRLKYVSKPGPVFWAACIIHGSSRSTQTQMTIGTFRLHVNEGMWRHDQDSGMEPASARWAVTWTKHVTSCLSSCQRGVTRPWQRETNRFRVQDLGSGRLSARWEHTAACRCIGSFRAPRSMNRKLPNACHWFGDCKIPGAQQLRSLIGSTAIARDTKEFSRSRRMYNV